LRHRLIRLLGIPENAGDVHKNHTLAESVRAVEARPVSPLQSEVRPIASALLRRLVSVLSAAGKAGVGPGRSYAPVFQLKQTAFRVTPLMPCRVNASY